MTTRTWVGRVFIGISLDGFIARADGDIEWLTDPPAGRTHAAVTTDVAARDWDTFYPAVSHLVMGRGTYEKVLTFGEWPYAGKQVLVLSTALTTDDANITVVRTLGDAVAELTRRGARDVYVDGGKVIQAFLQAGLIDEITVGIAPVLIGDGLPLFGRLDSDQLLELAGVHATDSGMVHVTYRLRRRD